MSVYNVEPYIEEAVNSIIEQDINFTENVQIIFVNDGSTDSSGKFCEKYKTAYPHNVVVVHKQNEGLAKARQAGIPFVKGKYVSFFDPDDILSKETLRNVYAFFEKNFDKTDVVAIPIIMFGVQKGQHPLNNKFNGGSRIIDLKTEPNIAQMSMASAFFKKEAISNLDADPTLVVSEDAKELFKILMRKQTIGVVKEACYHYRKRPDSNVGGARQKKDWYLKYLTNFTEWAIHYSISSFGEIPQFIQYTLLYDLQWKLLQQEPPLELFTDEELLEYQNKLFELTKYFDTNIICSRLRLCREHIIYLLYKKFGTPPQLLKMGNTNGVLAFDNCVISTLDKLQTRIEFIRFDKDCVTVEGSQLVPLVGLDEPKIYLKVDKQLIPTEKNDFSQPIRSSGVDIAKRVWFKGKVKLPASNVGIVTQYGELTVNQKVVFGKHAPIGLPQSYYCHEGYIIQPSSTGFVIKPGGMFKKITREFKFCRFLAKKDFRLISSVILRRLACHFLRLVLPKNIWLVTDKANKAGDNGEALFEYLVKNKAKIGCTPIFAISKSSPDYERIKKIGPVIPYMSEWHKLIHLVATRTISAYSHDEITSPFLKKSAYFADLLQRSKIVFLQHGIIKDDVSKGLNRPHKNFALFVTSAQREAESIRSGNYGYDPEQVILTGLPRYDYLVSNCEKHITIMPTWRRNLVGSYSAKTSQWSPLPNFKESLFYKFYDELLNSKELLDKADELGYQIRFLPHPVFFIYNNLLNFDKRVLVYADDVSYRDVYAKSELVVTDFSSAVFDFVYLGKPVIYCHFDTNHYNDGYFDYERDGFGEVEHTVPATVSRIIEYMENNCKIKDLYAKRVADFFAFNDRKNCERVVEKIINLD